MSRPGTFRAAAAAGALTLATFATTGCPPTPSWNYGANGPYLPEIHEIASPLFPEKPVTIYLPLGVPTPVPTIFFAHGYGGTEPIFYNTLLAHLASLGFAAVFSPYPTLDTDGILDRYETLWAGFEAAAAAFPTRLDLTRVGFAGHSFGGGAVPAMARRGIVDRGWGSAGALLFPMAPWYVYDMTPAELAGFPASATMIVSLYDDDVLNDHRIAADLFEAIGIPDANKVTLKLYSDAYGTPALEASHSVPTGPPFRVEDALDHYGVRKPLDALMDWTFNGNPVGRDVALGNGNFEQTFMGTWPDGTPVVPAEVTDNPVATKPQATYEFPCVNVLFNPRWAFCPA